MIIPPTWQLPDAIRLRLGTTTYGRQRAIVEEGHLVLVLHKPPGPDDVKRDSALFWRNPAGEWQHSRGGGGPGALRRHVQSYVEIESQLTQRYENATNATVLFELLEAITPLVRSSRNMHAALQAAREAIKQDQFIIEMRDQAQEVERNLELLLEDVRNALQYRTARESEEQARLGREALQASHRLNSLAALFLPLTAVTSLFSMNFRHGLNEGSVFMFWLIFALGVALGFAIKSWVLAKPPAAEPPPKA